jgi:hypothetical protein
MVVVVLVCHLQSQDHLLQEQAAAVVLKKAPLRLVDQVAVEMVDRQAYPQQQHQETQGAAVAVEEGDWKGNIAVLVVQELLF